MIPARLLLLMIITGTIAASCSRANKETRWILNPSKNSVYHFTISEQLKEGDSAGFFKNITANMDYTLQCVYTRDSVYTFKLLIGPYSIDCNNTLYSTAAKKWEKPVVKLFDMSLYYNVVMYYTQFAVGDSLLMEVDTKGKVKQVNGFENMITRVTAATGDDRRTVRAYLEELAGTGPVQDRLTQVFQYLPAKNIRINDNWVSNMLLTANAPVKYSNLLTVKHIQNDTVTLNVQTAISASTGEGGRVYAEGARRGEVQVSYATGILYQCDLYDSVVTRTDHNLYRKECRLEVKRKW